MDRRGCVEGDWVALLVRMNYERIAASHLDRYGYQPFLPLHPARARGRRAARAPMFPGYLFCRYRVGNPRKILQVAGVIRILGDGGPVSVPAAQVDAVRRIVDAGVASAVCEPLHLGQRVRVIAGPLAGLCGTLAEARGGMRVVVAVDILRRAVSADVTRDQLEAIDPSDHRRAGA